jgi:hypothetical protein
LDFFLNVDNWLASSFVFFLFHTEWWTIADG